MTAPRCRFPLGGFVSELGIGKRDQRLAVVGVTGLLRQRVCSACVETPVATMTGTSEVEDVVVVVLVGSSPTCSWVCLGVFVAKKSKLLWRFPGGIR